MRSLLLVFGIACILGNSSAAFADPISFSESVSGDLLSPTTTNFVLDVGVNTVSGTTAFFDVPDWDSFRFTIRPDIALTDFEYSFTTSPLPGTQEAFVHFALRRDEFADIGFAGVNLFGASPVTLFPGTVLSSGTYVLEMNGLGAGGDTFPLGWSAAYTWNLSVEPVPEPASLTLVGVGLLGVRLCYRRRSRASLNSGNTARC